MKQQIPFKPIKHEDGKQGMFCTIHNKAFWKESEFRKHLATHNPLEDFLPSHESPDAIDKKLKDIEKWEKRLRLLHKTMLTIVVVMSLIAFNIYNWYPNSSLKPFIMVGFVWATGYILQREWFSNKHREKTCAENHPGIEVSAQRG